VVFRNLLLLDARSVTGHEMDKGKRQGPTGLCGQSHCRAYHLTISEFERLGGEIWTQSFRIRLGLLANERYVDLYGKKPKKVRSSTRPDWRNKVSKYPCGILERACRELKARDAATDAFVGPLNP
jgi:hypothetical protein